MARAKKTESQEVWPKVIQGSHSTRTEYEDGRVEFVTDWEALKKDVSQAIAEYELGQLKPEVKPKATRKKKGE